MARRIAFYFDDDDERKFLRLPQLREALFIKLRDLNSAHHEIYNELHLKPHSQASQSQAYLCFEADLKLVRYHAVEGGGSYFVDGYHSPVIEFSRSGCKTELNSIISGRLWYQHKYRTRDAQGNSVVIEKSDDLKRLYNSLARWVRKHCTLLPSGIYIGPHAMKLHENGVKLGC